MPRGLGCRSGEAKDEKSLVKRAIWSAIKDGSSTVQGIPVVGALALPIIAALQLVSRSAGSFWHRECSTGRPLDRKCCNWTVVLAWPIFQIKQRNTVFPCALLLAPFKSQALTASGGDTNFHSRGNLPKTLDSNSACTARRIYSALGLLTVAVAFSESVQVRIGIGLLQSGIASR